MERQKQLGRRIKKGGDLILTLTDSIADRNPVNQAYSQCICGWYDVSLWAAWCLLVGYT